MTYLNFATRINEKYYRIFLDLDTNLVEIYYAIKALNGIALIAYRSDGYLKRIPVKLTSFEEFLDSFINNAESIKIHSGEDTYLEIESIDIYPI
jgi:hypothetical protein